MKKEIFDVRKGEHYIITKEENILQHSVNTLLVEEWMEQKMCRREVGNIIYYADGECAFQIEEIKESYIIVEALNTYTLENRKSISLGTFAVDDSYILKIRDFAKNIKIDCIALSFIEEGEEINRVKRILQNKNIIYVSKIESTNAIKNIKSILGECDGIMIARGDLGLYAGSSNIAKYQEMLIEKSKAAGKKIFIATGIMTSLIKNNIPTAADVIDVVSMKRRNVDGIILNNDLVYFNKIDAVMNVVSNN